MKEPKLNPVSIHAPARGATIAIPYFLLSPVFQSTLLREERLWSIMTKSGLTVFQSTLLREERPLTKYIATTAQGFNPRSCARSDIFPQLLGSITLCFNPRSCARSDERNKAIRREEHVSIHAPARGATVAMQSIIPLNLVSIHAPARGATSLCRPI